MRALTTIIIFIAAFCSCGHKAQGQVRVRRGIHLPKLGHEEKRHHNGYPTSKKRKPAHIKLAGRQSLQHDPLEDHFYVQWKKDRKLRYDDFRLNRNLYNKFVDDRDTDLINTVYPDYIAFYNKLKQRREQEPIIDEAEDERIEKMLQAKLDSMNKGYISTAYLDIDMSFTINIDSPAASVINLTPSIYAINESTWYFNITPVFSKYDSWMIVKSEDIRQHEQIHFDIFELYARKMRQHLLATLKKSYGTGMVNDLSTAITPVYEQLYQMLNQMQLDFDKQTGALTATNAPLNNTNAAWNKMLKEQLDALSEYELNEGTIMLSEH